MTYATPTRIETLMNMHGYCRPAGCKTERKFIAEYIRPLGVETDKAGNLIKRIGKDPSVMWSCHTDTVHSKPGRQFLTIADGELTANNSSCLGADDTAGVWLMCEMIKAQRPGLYIFHRAEEIGGVGSEHISYSTPHVLRGIGAAIALDRKGRSSIITHQWGGRCASDAFAESLSVALGGSFGPDSGGTFTDTANYMFQVPECTNLSVGYFNQHTSKESLDLHFLCELRERLLSIDTASLVIERDPLEIEVDPMPADDGLAYADQFDQTPRYHVETAHRGAHGGDFDRLEKLVCRNPREVADYLDSMGIDAAELERALYDRGVILDL